MKSLFHRILLAQSRSELKTLNMIRNWWIFSVFGIVRLFPWLLLYLVPAAIVSAPFYLYASLLEPPLSVTQSILPFVLVGVKSSLMMAVLVFEAFFLFGWQRVCFGLTFGNQGPADRKKKQLIARIEKLETRCAGGLDKPPMSA